MNFGQYKDRTPLTTAELQLKGSLVQDVSITDIISEGPIEGLVNGEASIYLEGDQLADVNTAGRISSRTDVTNSSSTIIPATHITIPAASGANQPVTATLLGNKRLDNSGNIVYDTTYLDEEAETYTDPSVFRYLVVFGVTSTPIRVITYQPTTTVDLGDLGEVPIPGHIDVQAWDSNSAQDVFFSYHKDVNAINTMRNLQPRVRVVSSSNQILRGSISELYTDTNFNSVDSSGGAPCARIKLWNYFTNSGLEKDVWSSSYSSRIAHLYIDWCAEAEVRLVSNNKTIYIPKWTNNFAISTPAAKTYTLSKEERREVDTGTGSDQNDPPNASQTKASEKYPGSAFEFRVGNLQQEPINQLGGAGVASFPVTLTAQQGEVFNSTNVLPTSLPAGYPTDADIVTGMVSKTITLSESFSGAQISEIDEIEIHFEFPAGHYSMHEDGTEWWSAAAFRIQFWASESGGSNPNDWVLINGSWNYKIINGGNLVKKKTAVSYIHKKFIRTHLRMRDLQIRLTRLTPNGTSLDNPYTLAGQGAKLINGGTDGGKISAVINDVKITNIIATIHEKQTYPYTALASVIFTSQSFPQPPKRAYHVRGLKVKIPTNYTPRHLSTTGKAIYTGIWNGEFSDEGTSNSSGLDIGTYYTDNPAWIFYDILINNRYGLGKFLQAQDINKFQLYKIAKYCDEEVTNKDGTTEPRFTANLYLTKATEAYRVLKDMATIFRGMVYWLDGQIHTVEDSPSTPVYNFSKSNIIDNTLSSQSTGSKTRANQYTVIWNNPLSGYKQEPIIMEDRQNILETGRIIPKKAVAFGCTSEGQAIRYGRWKTWTAINQTELLTFKTSINAAFLKPGDIVNVQDPDERGVHFSGRITASSNSAITLDRDIATISDEAQAEGGRTRGFEFGTTGNGYSYKLTLLVTTRKVVSEQDAPIVVTHDGATYTYNRGDEVEYAKVNGTSMALVGSDTNEQVEKNILNVEDDAGNHINIAFRNSTGVESRDFDSTDVSVVGGVTQIAIGSQFTDTIPPNTIWAIREIYKGVTTAGSYKEYKIIGLKEDKDKAWQISAVEFYNSKYNAVDADYTLAVLDPVNPPEQAFVPAPGAVYILQTSDYKSQQEELTVQWEPPRNNDGSEFTNVAKYVLHMNPPINDQKTIEVLNTSSLSRRFIKVPNGLHSIGVQVFTQANKRSKTTWASIDVNDRYEVSCRRTKEGVPSGIRSNATGSDSKNDSTSTGTTWSLSTQDWAIQSAGSPGVTVNNVNQSTAATYQQVVTSMATNGKEITAAFIYFDASDTNDYFKLATHTIFKCQNTILTYWQDYEQFASNSENVWTDCTGGADARVKLHKYSNKVEKSEGTTSFTTRFQVGDNIRIKTASNVYYGGKVAYIQSDDILFTDVKLNTTGSDLTSVDESKAIARNALRPDYSADAVIARINRSGSNYTHISLKGWEFDNTLEGLRALIVDPNIAFLNYNSSDVLQNEAAITITADALSYDDPEFIITGAGFSQTSESAQSTYVNDDTSGLSAPNDVTGQTLTWKLHDGTSGIAYNSGSSLDFSVTVRESTDQSNSKTKSFKIIKVQDGSIGVDGKTVMLTAEDYSITYDQFAQSPSYNGTNNDIILTATSHNFTDAIYKFTRTGPGSDVVLQNWSDTNTWAFLDPADNNANGIPAVHDKTHWPKVFKVEVGEKPSGWSAGTAPSGNVAIDSISIVGLVPKLYGVTISQPNNSHAYGTANDGTFTGTITGSGTTIEVFRGPLVATYVGKTDGSPGLPSGTTEANMAMGSWYISSITVTGSDVTLGGPTSVSNNIVTISDHTATANTDDTEVITYTIKVKSEASTNSDGYVFWTQTTVQSLTKAKGGPAGASVTGDDAPRNITGYLYWIGSAATTPGNSDRPGSTSYNFATTLSNAAFTPALATGSNNSANWSISPPAASSSRGTTFYIPFSAAETLSSGNQTGSGPVTFGGVQQGISFTGLVTFDSLADDLGAGGTNNITTIDGGKIKTGIISSGDVAGTDLSGGTAFTTDGSYFNLATGAIATQGFRVEPDGTAEFGGTINATGGFIGSNSSTNRWKIVGHLLLGGGGTDFASSNITLDGGNSTPRIIIRDPSANSGNGINHVILGKLS
tara:strand:- start:47 stop:6382 length:6336 start_codon:yes stop_codon:yes gene_type:complete